ncbi:hypothetical protein FB567DRAFT_252474 [Paraphoma chrysanthemicola]|uniref:Uncharacterized protein n=1 Tax=Paraphoma chrysanthemicola TaxID=798071 RepID=A0A8K0QSK6_9PLEO|nr:hypothetical protein FB567DRAFT_252474 [Paraphoma chrysanthemicola]
MTSSQQIKRALGPIAAFLVCILVVFFILLISFHETKLTQFGVYGTRPRSIYAAVSTILATLITMFISSQLCLLWLQELASQASEADADVDTTRLEAKWRVVLGVGSLTERFKSLRVQLSYLVAGLITAAIVASVTPSASTQSFDDYRPQISSGAPYPFSIYCASVFPPGQTPRGYFWNLSNGSRLYVNAPGGGCPTRWALRLTYGINVISPEDYAYTDSGVYIHASAMGAPISIYASRPGFSNRLLELTNKYNSEVIRTTQCVPVMKSNPVSCRSSGTLQVGANNLTAIADDRSCVVQALLPIDPRTTNAMAKGLCATGKVGQATMVLGATSAYAGWLALSMGDQSAYDAISAAADRGDTSARYVVTCNMDATNVYEFRNVTFSTRSKINGTAALRLSADGDTECSRPANYSQDMSGLLAEVAVAPWQVLLENTGLDGWFDTIANFAWINDGAIMRTRFAYNNSRNGLEDVLGITAALVGAYMNSTTVTIPASAIVANMRVGSGYRYAVAFILPPLIAAMAIALLTWRALRRTCPSTVKNWVKLPRNTWGSTSAVVNAVEHVENVPKLH